MYKRKGFTLIELIVVIAILAIIAAIAVPTAFASLDSARAAACASNIGNMQSAIRLERADTMMKEGGSGDTITPQEVEDALASCDIPASDITNPSTYVIRVNNLCPSGGFYTIRIDSDANPDTVSFDCSVHGDEAQRATDIADGVDGLLNSDALTPHFSRSNSGVKNEGSFMSWKDSANNEIINNWLAENGYDADKAWRADYRLKADGEGAYVKTLITAVDLTNEGMQNVIKDFPWGTTNGNKTLNGWVKVLRTEFDESGAIVSIDEGYQRIIGISGNEVSVDETRTAISVQTKYFKTADQLTPENTIIS